jgi:hypothetical protein
LYEFSVWIRSPAANCRVREPRRTGWLAQRLQVHLDASPGFVVEADMRIAVQREVETEPLVEVIERVAVEGGGHAERVVVGGIEDHAILLAVDADQQSAFRVAHALLVHSREEAHGFFRSEIADARSRVEEGGGARVERLGERQSLGEIGDDAQHLHLREIRRHAGERLFDLRAGDVHRDIPRGRDECEP